MAFYQKGKGIIDNCCKADIINNYHIYHDGSDLYSATLNQTNIKANNNKFYIIQLLQSDSQQDLFILYIRYGRVGNNGRTQYSRNLSKLSGIHQFENKFSEKTGNHWENKTNFQKISGKYDLLEMETESLDGETESLDKEPADADPETESLDKEPADADPETGSKDPETSAPTNNIKKKTTIVKKKTSLPKAVQDLISLIFDINMITSTLKEFNIDLQKMPLGKISSNQIKKAYSILKELSENLNSFTEDQLIEYSSQFYTLVPFACGLAPPPIIKNNEILQNRLDLLKTLDDLEVIGKIIKNDENTANKTQNPIDLKYLSLNCDLTPLEDPTETQMILNYIKNTHASTHHFKIGVKEIFTCQRKNEAQRFQAYKDWDNRQLLWHGSRLANYGGILSQGLRIAPPEAPSTGYMFGKGIYFANSVSKSAQYLNVTGGIGCILLCEVALGKSLPKYNSCYINQLPQGYHSLHGIGRSTPNPQSTQKLIDGTFVPLGKLIQRKDSKCYLRYDEFIVYDISQVKIRYVILLDIV